MRKVLQYGLPAVAFLLIAAGTYIGLVWAPPDVAQGNAQRILYVHVPSVWVAGLCATLNLGASLAFLWKVNWKADSLAEASAEVGLLFGTVGVCLGAIWGRPTWGVYWTWDPRLTTAAIMLVAYAGYLALRKFIEDPERRAVWSAVVGIIAYVDIPIVWFSVRWWKGLHQLQSTSRSVDPQIAFAWGWNVIAFMVLTAFFVWQRYRIAQAERQQEVALPEALPPAQAGTEVAR